MTRHAGPYLTPSREKTAQGRGIPNGIGTTVIIDAREDLAVRALPIPDAVRPPRQVLISRGPAVNMLMVWSVQAHADEVRRAVKDAGEMCMGHRAPGSP